MRISCIRPAAGDGGFPLAEQSLAHAGLHLRLEAAVGAPEAFDLFTFFQKPQARPARYPRAQRRYDCEGRQHQGLGDKNLRGSIMKTQCLSYFLAGVRVVAVITSLALAPGVR